MRTPTESQALGLLPRRLADLLGLAPTDAKIRRQPGDGAHADAVIEPGGFTFVLEWKGSGTVARVSDAARQVLHHASRVGKRAIPLVEIE